MTFPPGPGMGASTADLGLLVAHPANPAVSLVTAALVLPAQFPRLVNGPGQCTRAREHRAERPLPQTGKGDQGWLT